MRPIRLWKILDEEGLVRWGRSHDAGHRPRWLSPGARLAAATATAVAGAMLLGVPQASAAPAASAASSIGIPYEIAVQANTGTLWTTSNGQGPGLTPGTVNLGLSMWPGTSPSIANIPNKGAQVAFESNTSALWTTGPLGSGNL